ncbi:MAG: DUF5615 family PIN-like protein [Bacteroidetes bacterium]|nr:DUF5615 family PIN-like protein [Bacteroidota bacterium]
MANENFPFPSISFIRNEGHFIFSISELSNGISDEQVIQKAIKENLIILTFDKDYGELIFKFGITNPPAVVFFRYKGNNPLFAGKILCDLTVKAGLKLEKNFTVIEENDIRQRQY